MFSAWLAQAISLVPARGAEVAARELPIAGDAQASGGAALFTDRRTQYAAFFATDGTLVLARRALGADAWETQRTRLREAAGDAPDLALAVDGVGHLHVAWVNESEGFHCARARGPGSLELETASTIAGLSSAAARVSTPKLFRLPDGDLLLFCGREDPAGKGLALFRYAVPNRAWHEVQHELIADLDGSSGEPACALDADGNVHLAWVMRGAEDARHLAYARSNDGGRTWQNVRGEPLRLPIAAEETNTMIRLAADRGFVAPPALAADPRGRPVIVSGWAAADGAGLSCRLVHFDGTAWQVNRIDGSNLTPQSRPALFVQQPWQKHLEAFVVVRDATREGRLSVAACRDIEAGSPEWSWSDLAEAAPDAGELVVDPVQWQRMHQVHLLVQRKRDDIAAGARDDGAAVATVIWSPLVATFAPDANTTLTPPSAGSFPVAGALDRPLVAADVLALMERVADWQRAQPYGRDPRGWEIAPFYIGLFELAKLSASPRFHDELLRRCEAMQWAPGPRDYHADDQCVVQAYLALYGQHREARMLAPSRALFDRVLARPATTPLDWGTPGAQDRWAWCDALFMAPAAWLEVFNATGDRRYLDFMNREWWRTTEALFVRGERLFARDESFLDLREPNGRRLFWSRGNGWVLAGLARVLDRLPRDHADHPRYVQLYRDMIEAVLAAQRPDGLWSPGLLDSHAHPARETSGSSFFAFALAWGVNRGLLDRARGEPAARRAWNALAASVTAEGKLEHVQPIGAAPEGFDPAHSDTFAIGAFLLAGCEIHRMADGAR